LLDRLDPIKKKQLLHLTEDSEDDILVPKESSGQLPEKKDTEYYSSLYIFFVYISLLEELEFSMQQK
jgi:hypothetical protein